MRLLFYRCRSTEMQTTKLGSFGLREITLGQNDLGLTLGAPLVIGSRARKLALEPLTRGAPRVSPRSLPPQSSVGAASRGALEHAPTRRLPRNFPRPRLPTIHSTTYCNMKPTATCMHGTKANKDVGKNHVPFLLNCMCVVERHVAGLHSNHVNCT